MKRLTIHLNFVEKTGNKVFNTVAHIITDDKQIPRLLGKYGGNVKKHYISNMN